MGDRGNREDLQVLARSGRKGGRERVSNLVHKKLNKDTAGDTLFGSIIDWRYGGQSGLVEVLLLYHLYRLGPTDRASPLYASYGVRSCLIGTPSQKRRANGPFFAIEWVCSVKVEHRTTTKYPLPFKYPLWIATKLAKDTSLTT